MRKYYNYACTHISRVETLPPLRNLFLPHRQGKAMDPVFIKDFSDVFASFNTLMNIPEAQLKGIHVVQVGGACCHGNINRMCRCPVTESDDGIFSSRSTRAARSLHSPRDCVSRPCLSLFRSICLVPFRTVEFCVQVPFHPVSHSHAGCLCLTSWTRYRTGTCLAFPSRN